MARFEIESVDLAVIGGRPMSADVFFELGIVYSCGRDVEVDLITAHKWFNLAAMSGSEAAKDYRAEIAAELSGAER
ncbi:MAG: SEL1-like repeat protein, partial [Pseudomonadota bacterium]